MRRTHISLKFLAAAACAALAVSANAQTMEKEAGPEHQFTVELRPFSPFFAAVPESGTYGLGIESQAGPKSAWVAEAHVLDPTMRTPFAETVPETLRVRDVDGFTAAVGYRAYSRPEDSSWYSQAVLGYALAESDFSYRGTVVESRSETLLPAIGFGYRWILDNNLLWRIGAGLAANAVQSVSVEGEGTDETVAAAEEEVEGIRQRELVATVDFGLGYAF